MPPPEVVVSPRKPDTSSKQLYSQNGRMLKPSAEYNRRVAITEDLRAGRSATEIIRFFRYPRSTIYDIVAKIFGFRTVQWRFQYVSEEESLEKTHHEDPCSRWKGSSADFGWSRAIVAKISIDCWRANNASNCRGEVSIQIVHIKDTTDALWGFQDKPSCSPRLSFWFPNSLDLNPLNYV